MNEIEACIKNLRTLADNSAMPSTLRLAANELTALRKERDELAAVVAVDDKYIKMLQSKPTTERLNPDALHEIWQERCGLRRAAEAAREER